jgi:hypothetical protein
MALFLMYRLETGTDSYRLAHARQKQHNSVAA